MLRYSKRQGLETTPFPNGKSPRMSEETKKDEVFRSGFACLIGRPNVGKSTLVNRLVGRHVSIATPKPQTTRTRILGVSNAPGSQLVLIDTPGIHMEGGELNTRMLRYAEGALEETDLVLLLMEPAWPPGNEDRKAMELARKAGGGKFLVLNKVDAAREADVPAAIAAHAQEGGWDEIVPVSALTGRGVKHLRGLMADVMPEGPEYFPPGMHTDQPEQQIVAELIRGEVIRRMHQELPYRTAVEVEEMSTRNKVLRIHARIHVERDSQRGILIGKGGQMLKTLGTAARKRIEGLLGARVFLDLHVGVLKGWSEDPRHLARLGYPEK